MPTKPREKLSPVRGPCARTSGGISLPALAFLMALLALPAYSLSRYADQMDWKILAGVPALVSIFAYLAYRSDKARAEAGRLRIPEASLHLAELLGGWPGAFLAQRKFRHKTAKTSFQMTFWTIVFLHQLLALDSILGWKLSRDLLQLTGFHHS
jgi:uncharacterized membrane protein YsdA (DUF1294 family)